jgi:hypothetical protein
MWINDVVTRTTILSTWGNGVRNQLVQIFASLAEADSHKAALPVGALATIGGVPYILAPGPTWKTFVPRLVQGTITYTGVIGNMNRNIGSITIPAGYTTAALAVSCLVYTGEVGGATFETVQAKILDGVTQAQILATNQTISNWATFAWDRVVGVNVAGQSFTLTMQTPSVNESLNIDGAFSGFSAVCFP